MTGGVVNIGYVELVGASLLMLVAGIVSWRMGLGQTRRIAVSTVRAFLQLLAMGLLLGYLFKYQTWWLVCLVLLGMCIAATQIATGRTNKVVRGLWADVFLSITVSSMVIAFIVVEGIIHADPWYNGGWLRVRGVHAGRWEDDLPSKRDHGRQRTRYKRGERMRLASR